MVQFLNHTRSRESGFFIKNKKTKKTTQGLLKIIRRPLSLSEPDSFPSEENLMKPTQWANHKDEGVSEVCGLEIKFTKNRVGPPS